MRLWGSFAFPYSYTHVTWITSGKKGTRPGTGTNLFPAPLFQLHI